MLPDSEVTQLLAVLASSAREDPQCNWALSEFVAAYGWRVRRRIHSDPVTSRHAEPCCVIVDLDSENSALLSFMPAYMPAGSLGPDRVRELAEIGYNQGVEWMLVPDPLGFAAYHIRSYPWNPIRISSTLGMQSVSYVHQLRASSPTPSSRTAGEMLRIIVLDWLSAAISECSDDGLPTDILGLISRLIGLKVREERLPAESWTWPPLLQCLQLSAEAGEPASLALARASEMLPQVESFSEHAYEGFARPGRSLNVPAMAVYELARRLYRPDTPQCFRFLFSLMPSSMIANLYDAVQQQVSGNRVLAAGSRQTIGFVRRSPDFQPAALVGSFLGKYLARNTMTRWSERAEIVTAEWQSGVLICSAIGALTESEVAGRTLRPCRVTLLVRNTEDAPNVRAALFTQAEILDAGALRVRILAEGEVGYLGNEADAVMLNWLDADSLRHLGREAVSGRECMLDQLVSAIWMLRCNGFLCLLAPLAIMNARHFRSFGDG